MPSSTRAAVECVWSKTLAFRSNQIALKVSMKMEFAVLRSLLERLVTASGHQCGNVLIGIGMGIANPSRRHTPIQMLTAKEHRKER
jgi:hypothetical protein